MKTVDPTPRMDDHRSDVTLNGDSCSSSQQHRRCQDGGVVTIEAVSEDSASMFLSGITHCSSQ
jgi:hypothetical protein